MVFRNSTFVSMPWWSFVYLFFAPASLVAEICLIRRPFHIKSICPTGQNSYSTRSLVSEICANALPYKCKPYLYLCRSHFYVPRVEKFKWFWHNKWFGCNSAKALQLPGTTLFWATKRHDNSIEYIREVGKGIFWWGSFVNDYLSLNALLTLFPHDCKTSYEQAVY